jgi:hypothetical protein
MYRLLVVTNVNVVLATGSARIAKGGKPVSLRGDAQDRIVACLLEYSFFFDAPYGVLEELLPLGSRPGYVRKIAFGIARLLDATIEIWSVNRIVINAQGPLSRLVIGVYRSPDEVIDMLSRLLLPQEA